MRRSSLFLLALPLLWLVSCASQRKTATSPQAPATLQTTHLDLQEGWRVRVVTPLLAGGGYQVKTSAAEEKGNHVTLRASQDFLGYETSYYAVQGKGRVRFTQAETMRDGQSTPQPKPVHPLFQKQHGGRLVRLLFLERASTSEHNMAILSARNLKSLEQRTARVRQDPTGACQQGCEWVPAGIAVRAERLKDGSWVPAR